MDNLDSIRARRRSNTLRTLLPTGIILVIVLIIVGSATHLFDGFFRATAPMPTPTPQAPLVPGDDLFLFNVGPWGTVSIDGRSYTLTQLPSEFSGERPMRLRRGFHTIVWHADPFKPLICRVSVPSSTNGSCNYESHARNINARLITFLGSLLTLPDAQRTALIQQTQSALDALGGTELVQSGEQYTVDPGSGIAAPVTATQPLKAKLHIRLDADPNSNRSCSQFNDNCTNNFSGSGDCHLFCTFPDLGGPPTGTTPTPTPTVQHWFAQAIAYAGWDYALNNTVIAHDQPDTFFPAAGNEHSIQMDITWDGTKWHVNVNGDTFNGDITCSPAFALATSLYNITADASPITLDWHSFIGAHRVVGCLEIGVPAQGNTLTPVVDPTPFAVNGTAAYCLYRFGVLVAANDLAHKEFPSLPVADAYEQGIAQQIVMQNKL